MKLFDNLRKLNTNFKNKRRVMNIGYAIAIAFAFVLSLTNNKDVSASVAPKQPLSYIMLESQISDNLNHDRSVYPSSSIENIKSLFEQVNYNNNHKIVENQIVVSAGDSFISILGNLGLSYNEAYDLYSKFKPVFDTENLRVGQKLFITTNTAIEPNVEEAAVTIENITIEPTVGQRYILERGEDAEYTARMEKDELIKESSNAFGMINGTLSQSMSNKGVPHKIVAEFINIFAFSIDFRRDVRRGDKFEIIYESYVSPQGEVIKTGDIVYASLQLRRDKIALYRFKDKFGNVEYYTEKGLPMKKTLDRKPMSFKQARISSPFGKRRHPIYKDLRIHWGVDYAAPAGSLVYAGGDGIVEVAKYNGGYGNYIKIRHNSEYSSAYGHLKSFAKGIRPGVRVKQGQIIGYVGSTGRSTGPHLHYEVVKNGRRVNPLTIKASTGENLKGTNLANFKKVVADIQMTYSAMFAENNKKQVASK